MPQVAHRRGSRRHGVRFSQRGLRKIELLIVDGVRCAFDQALRDQSDAALLASYRLFCLREQNRRQLVPRRERQRLAAFGNGRRPLARVQRPAGSPGMDGNLLLAFLLLGGERPGRVSQFASAGCAGACGFELLEASQGRARITGSEGTLAGLELRDVSVVCRNLTIQAIALGSQFRQHDRHPAALEGQSVGSRHTAAEGRTPLLDPLQRCSC